jgi:DNA-binding transcriptional regulator YiaG
MEMRKKIPISQKYLHHKLNPEKVREIRRAKGKTDSELAAKYGVGKGTIYSVRNWNSWRWVQIVDRQGNPL